MKKFISYLAALAMAASIIPSGFVNAEALVVEQEANGVVILDDLASSYNEGFRVQTPYERAFGGSLLIANRDSAMQPEIDWTFNVNDASGLYDIWVLGSDISSNTTGLGSAFQYSMNGGAYTDQTRTNEVYKRFTVYNSNFGYNDTLAYYKFASKVELSEGQNTFSYTLNKNTVHNGYLNAVDRILIVPSSFKWYPNTDVEVNDIESYIHEAPEDKSVIKADANGNIILEAEAGDVEGAAIYQNEKAFGGAYVEEFNTYTEDPYISWNVEIPNDREYDVWALVLMGNGGAMEMNTMQMSYDEEPNVPVQKSKNQYKRWTNDWPSGYYLYWTKVYSKHTFGKGVKQFYYTRQTQGAPHDLFILDRVAIVPADYCWRPSDKDYTGTKDYLTEDIPCVMDAPFQPDENNVIWMEAENADLEQFSVVDNASASGGKYASIERSGDTSGSTYHVNFLFDVDKAQSYDIWVLAPNYPEMTWYSHYTSSLDGEEYKAYAGGYTFNGYDISDFPNLYSYSILGNPAFTAKWTRVNMSEALEAGRHKFSLGFNERPQGGGFYISQVDAVAVVPTNLNWVPDSINKPQKRENGYAWIEMESSDNGTAFSKICATSSLHDDYYQSASNGTYIRANSDAIKGNQRLNYSFALANSGKYDIYFLGSDVNQDHLSKLYYDIDSSADSVCDEAHKANPSWKSKTVMRALGDDAVAQEYWQKIGDGVDITAGAHVLNMEWAERSGVSPTGSNYSGHYLQADALVIVPTEWDFAMPDEISTKAAVTAMDLDVTEKFEMLKKAYANGVYSDLQGLDTYGSSGSAFTYATRSSAISADGTVTRPEIGADPVEADIEIFAHKVPSKSSDTGYKYNVNSDSSLVISLNVMPMDAVVFSDFTAAYADGSAIVKNTLTSGATVNASVSIKKMDDAERSAIIAAAVYKDGVLVGVESDNIALTGEMQPLTTSITLPTAEDMSGYSVKVFLWDSLADANPYTEALKY